MIRLLRTALLGVLLAATTAAAAPDPIADLRADYHSAVTDPVAIGRGLARVQALRTAAAGGLSPANPTLTAYEGALITLRAKHAAWPPTRLRHLRQGLAILDGVLARTPDHLEARYLRLMSCYSLPSVLGRKASVAEDFAVLARLLPAARGDYPPDQYRAIVGFVLQKGVLSAAERLSLQNSLDRSIG